MQTTFQKNCRLCIQLNTGNLKKLYKNEGGGNDIKKRRLMKKRKEAFFKKLYKWFLRTIQESS